MTRLAYCFDLDGTITSNHGFGVSEIKLPWFILWIVLRLYKPKLNQRIVDYIMSIKENGEKVIIVTSRPKELEKITISYLKEKNIPFDEIFFLGTGPGFSQRKVLKLKEIKALSFYDNNKKTVAIATKEGIKSFLITKQDK